MMNCKSIRRKPLWSNIRICLQGLTKTSVKIADVAAKI
jgi:hypothetical protein